MNTCQVNERSITGPGSSGSSLSLSTNLNGESAVSLQLSPNGEPTLMVEDQPEVLGSVVHSHESENGEKNGSVQLRTSARVSKKMRLDVIANQTPPERKGKKALIC